VRIIQIGRLRIEEGRVREGLRAGKRKVGNLL